MLKPIKLALRDCVGGTSPVLALAVIPMFLAVGSAIDYVRWFNARTELTSALDGAALAAAQGALTSSADRIETGETYFTANFSNSAIPNPLVEVSVSGTSVRVIADLDFPTSFMNLAGISTMDLNAEAEASLPQAGNAELVLVLDYSGSMNSNQKYQRMADAATDMIVALEDAAEDVDFKIGLVPFSAMVRTSMPAAYVTQATAGATWTGCTQDRRYPYNTGVSMPTAANATKWGYIDNNGENNGAYSCNAYATKNLTITPLTSNLASVRESLDDMLPLGNTNISLGAEFGWNLLDPALPFDQARPYTDTGNKKYMVLLTDGVQTSREWGPGNSRTVSHAQANLLTLCSGMRDSGITIFTIAYDVTDPQVTNLLEACAPGRYFEPAVGSNDLDAVFSEITNQITDDVVRLTK